MSAKRGTINYPERRSVRGVTETELLCSTCRYWLPDDKFYRRNQPANNKYRRGRSYHCKVCDRTQSKARYEQDAEARREYARQYRKENPDFDKRTPAAKEYNWRQQSMKKYGITVAEYDAMFERQKGLCAICGQPEAANRDGEAFRLAVDHDHGTGKVRGLLCASCNNGLGRFGDDPERLMAAAAYLLEHGTVLGFLAGATIS